MNMALVLRLEIVTSERKILETEASSVTLPGSEGELGILPDHVPLLTTLNTGVLLYHHDSKIVAVAVRGGYAQVDTNMISVLADTAQISTEINADEVSHMTTTATDEETKKWALALQEAVKYQ